MCVCVCACVCVLLGDSLQEDYYSYCRRPRRTILEVLADFPSVASGVDLGYLLELIPGLQPRSFSIASSMAVGRSYLPATTLSAGPS